MRPIIIIGFSVFPSFVFLSFWCRDICVTVGTDSSWLLGAGLEGPECASRRETLLWSIETHRQSQQLQISFPCCGQTHPQETQRPPRAGLELCLCTAEANSGIAAPSAWPQKCQCPTLDLGKGKQTQHVTAGLTCMPWQCSQQLQHRSCPVPSPQIPHRCCSCCRVTRAAEAKRQTNRSAF